MELTLTESESADRCVPENFRFYRYTQKIGTWLLLKKLYKERELLKRLFMFPISVVAYSAVGNMIENQYK